MFLISNFEIGLFTFNTSYFLLFLNILLILYLIGNNLGIAKNLIALTLKIFRYLKELPMKIQAKTLAYSFIRYFVFSHQFYFLLILVNLSSTREHPFSYTVCLDHVQFPQVQYPNKCWPHYINVA